MMSLGASFITQLFLSALQKQIRLEGGLMILWIEKGPQLITDSDFTA